ncbi:tetratricopeptide repeat protein [Roseovarius sp.]|uniref:tetratricopeptide repeat protein n=1 Tax=Roseovarius sp. TaxID=1486281 RepID=UPI00263030B6|nr:tetratricopeptide repeat protein [Roseovarius sp.]
MLRILSAVLFAIIIVFAGVVAYAADLQKGLDAADAKDYATALRELEPLAEQGDALAQTRLGYIYAYGAHDLRDEVEAVKWFRLAAEQGDANAQYQLGFMYHHFDRDYFEAMKWYRLAAKNGDFEAQNILGNMYRNGRGVLKDDVEAVKWYRLAADPPLYSNAMYNLGFMYANGRGVQKDMVLAHMWSNIASAKGQEVAAKNRDIYENLMTSEQIAEATHRAKACMGSLWYGNCD